MQHQATNITIPDIIKFSDLKLARTSNGNVKFDWTPIEEICHANSIDISVFRDTEDNIPILIVSWYEQHLLHGGERDPVADDLMSKAMAKDTLDDGASHN